MYISDELNIVMECRGDITPGANEKCPEELTSFHVTSRHPEISDEHLQLAQTELELRTHGCYNVSLTRVEVHPGK